MLLIVGFANPDKRNRCEAPTRHGQHRFQGARADDGTEDVEQRHVTVANSMEHNDVSHEVGVGLLPKRFLALTPNCRYDRSDVECLGISIGVVIERVVADVAGQ